MGIELTDSNCFSGLWERLLEINYSQSRLIKISTAFSKSGSKFVPEYKNSN